MGRPRKLSSEKRASKLAVRFKRDELLQLDLFAATTNQTVSEYVRTQTLGSPAPATNHAGFKHDTYRDLRAIEETKPGAPVIEIVKRIRARLETL